MIASGSMPRWVLPIFIGIAFACSLPVMLAFFVGAVGSGYNGLDASPYGVPSRPYVYRTLIPTTAKIVRNIIPEAIEQPLTKKMIAWRDSDEGKKIIRAMFLWSPPISDDKIFETAVVAFICYLTLLAFLWMFYVLARTLLPDKPLCALIAPLLALQFIQALTAENGFIYDFAELFFSCACFYLLYRQRWGLYLVTLALATLNKETTVFVIFFFAVWFFKRLPRKEYITLLLKQVTIYAIICGALMMHFSDKPSTQGRPHFVNNTLVEETVYHVNLMDHWHYIEHHTITFFPGTLVMLIIIFYHWREKPLFLRGGLWMLFANLIAYSTCNPGEYRDLYWSMPIVILMFTHSLVTAIEAPPQRANP